MTTQTEALKLALEALDQLTNAADTFSVSGVYFNEGVWAKKCLSDAYFAITTIEQALAQPEQEPVAKGKLKVTLQDTPTEIELAQYKRMFEAACSALGAIGEALGIDEEEGGAEPILAAIEELKAQPKEQEQEPVAFICQGNVYMADDVDKYCTAKHIPLYTKEQL